MTRPEASATPGEHEGADGTATAHEPAAARPSGSAPVTSDEAPSATAAPGDQSPEKQSPQSESPDSGSPDSGSPDSGSPESDDAEAADDDRTDGGPASSRTLRIALAVAALLLVAAALVLGWLWRENELDERAREQALTAARQSAINLTSIDQEDFEGDVGRVLDGATGEFRTDFSGRVAQLQQLVEENEVSAEGRVLEAGLVRADRESATALVVVDSEIRNTAVPEGRVNSYRMRIELEKVGDEWRTSSLEFVG